MSTKHSGFKLAVVGWGCEKRAEPGGRSLCGPALGGALGGLQGQPERPPVSAQLQKSLKWVWGGKGGQ